MEYSKLLLLLKVRSKSQSLAHGKLLHQRIFTCGFQDDDRLWHALFHLYFSYKSYDAAASVLQAAENPFHISLWNVLVSAYCKNGRYWKALDLFGRLLKNPLMEPDIFSYPSVLKACGALGMAKDGSALHAHLVKVRLVADTVVASSLSGMYGKCCLFTECVQVFDEIPQKDVACWNEVISSFYHSGLPEQALIMFDKMKRSGFMPSSPTFTTAICACARLGNARMGMEIHNDLVKSEFLLDDYVTAALVDLYAKCGYLEKSREIFELMSHKTTAAWNSVISAYCHQLNNGECFKLFRRMTLEGNIPNLTTLSIVLSTCSVSSDLRYGKFVHGYIVKTSLEADAFIKNSLIDLYFKFGKVQSAENIFCSLKSSDVACWNVMIRGYVQVGHNFAALHTYYRMMTEGVKPDAITYASALPACSKLASLDKGREIHKSIVENGMENNEVVMGALLDMYGKCGAIEQASDIFLKLPKRDLISWTTMIAAYGYHGQSAKALNLLQALQRAGLKPDELTYLAVLTTCSNGGLAAEGCGYFSEMTEKYGINPRLEHYACLIDMLVRAGKLPEAHFIAQRAGEVLDNTELLSTLISSSSLQLKSDLRNKVAKLLDDKLSNDPSLTSMPN